MAPVDIDLNRFAPVKRRHNRGTQSKSHVGCGVTNDVPRQALSERRHRGHGRDQIRQITTHILSS